MKELVFTIIRNSTLPVYQQVYRYIKNQIVSGKIVKDSKLPSIRQLAATLQVSRNTSQLAYEQLQAEGYIRSEPKKGYYVQASISELHHSYEPIRHTKASSKSIVQPVIDFRAGAVDGTHFPLAKWRSLSNKVLNDNLIYQYGENQGDLLLRESLATYLFQSRGVRTTSEQIVIGSSTQQLLIILSILLNEEYNQIAVEDPGYNGARELFSLQSYSVVPIPVTEDGIDITHLDTCNARLVYVTPSHQFPLGMTMPINERYNLIAWAKKVNGYIIEDDYDSEFRYKQQPIPSLQSLTNSDHIIYMSTFSKALLPSIRLSYMVLPKKLLVSYHQIALLLEQTASTLHQRTLHQFIEEGYWHSHLRKMKALYKRKIIVLCDTLQLYFKDTVKIIGDSSGLYIVIEVKTKQSEEWLVKEALKKGVKVYPCSPFYIENIPRHPTIQLGFAGLEEYEIREGIEKLVTAWVE
ncbi:PLP-dependent aminotransferase family protein [Sporosarcina limicola]|uniref:GntR family transcriptional regulator/MocR family aminotransferase n=1 Tax=Sporosarcina limicola TaxID=34101 RepID=A0A927R632_9BACL|nr:PLP-dependent aminotransferase family protein [Sporosarcina limicola]MBE1556743.1 GntR family transcriptional regulator/MocR family aminotransferase [Sporosarcina limicola]